MNKKGGASVFLLILVTVIALGLAGGSYYFYYLLQKEQQAKVSLQQQLEETKVEAAKAKAQYEETLRALDDSRKNAAILEASLRQAKDAVDTATLELSKAKDANKQAFVQIDQLLAQLDQQKKSKSEIEKMFSQSQDEMSKMGAQLKDLQSKKQVLEAKVKELEDRSQKVELGKIVVSPESSIALESTSSMASSGMGSSSGLQGKVLVINKDYNFVVTNLGKKDGINVGDVFSVYHGENYVGDVKIEKIHDSMSAAGFVSTDVKDKVNEGDKVVQKR